MSLLKQIITGHINEFKSSVGIEIEEEKQKVFDSRAVVCNNCPLKSGNKCDPALSINPITLEVAPTKERRPGFIKGCGCRLSAKQKSPGSACPAGFWGEEFNK